MHCLLASLPTNRFTFVISPRFACIISSFLGIYMVFRRRLYPSQVYSSKTPTYLLTHDSTFRFFLFPTHSHPADQISQKTIWVPNNSHQLHGSMRYLSLWFGGILGRTPEEFKGQYGSQSGGIGSASAVSNAGIPVELWGQHGDWASFKSKKRYMNVMASLFFPFLRPLFLITGN